MDDQTRVLRRAAVRAGWNDAAWGQPRHRVDTAVAALYARGYAGGLMYKQHQPREIAEHDVSTPAPRVETAA